MQRDNFYIFSGGPGAGKTTTLEALAARGFVTVREAARDILKEQAASGGNATHDGDRARYRDLTLARMLRDYRAVAETAAPVFFDRAIPELSGYGNAPGETDPPALVHAIAECRYNPVVFLFPAWEAIYGHDDERKHSFAHAMAVTEEARALYPRFGYRVIEVPRASVEARFAFILERVGR
jgi:predicted ATPase